MRAAQAWWNGLTPEWQEALQEAYGLGDEPGDGSLEKLLDSPVLRLVGPGAPFPNISAPLPNLDGLAGFKQLNILVLAHNELESLDGLEACPTLTSLFLSNNQLKDIEAIRHCPHLQELHLQHNQITSLAPIRHLTQLHTLYCQDNPLDSLEGLTDAHSEKLTHFYCLPSPKLSNRDIVRTEQTLYIRCRKV